MAWLSFPLTWIVVATIACTTMSKARPMEESGGAKCKRALLAEGSYTRFCTYMSSWWPPRIENEPDGIPCGFRLLDDLQFHAPTSLKPQSHAIS
ncbi:uncharacterized protein LOC119171278 isoform X1 [Rhipicephalus microplus]|uniref:uncharacterized protein LOC119171278 isoform X1 n=1 Tax=Rhipicephalus microplus TaxID=6941 RepID=UPI003F6A7594